MPAKVTSCAIKMSQEVKHSLLRCETEEEFVAAVNKALDSCSLPPPNEDISKAIGHWKGAVIENQSLSGCTALCRLLIEYLSPNYSYAKSLNKWLLIDGFLALLDISLESGLCHEHQQYERLAFWEIHNDLLQTLIRDFPVDTMEYFTILSSSLLKNITDTSKDQFSRQLHLKSLNLLLEQAPVDLRYMLKNNHEIHFNALPDLLLEVGDYDFQASIVEVLFRTSVRSERAVLVSQWFRHQDCTIQSLFVRIVDFDPDCRRFLNALNQSQGESRRVHSFVCLAAAFGSVNLEKPKDPNYEHFWVDFNEGSCTVLLMCAKLGETASQQKREWESLLVYQHEVSKAHLYQTLHTQTLILTLNRAPIDFFSSPIPKGYEAKLSDHMTLEFSPQSNLVNVCRKIYRDKFEGCMSANDTPLHHNTESKCSYGNSTSTFSALSSQTNIGKKSECVVEESSQDCTPSELETSKGSQTADNANENRGSRMPGMNAAQVRRTLESEGTPGAATFVPWTHATESGSSVEPPKLEKNKNRLFKIATSSDDDQRGIGKTSKQMSKTSAPSSGSIETITGKVDPVVVKKTSEDGTLNVCDEDVVPSSLGEKERSEVAPLLKKSLLSSDEATVVKQDQSCKSSESRHDNPSLHSDSAVEKSCTGERKIEEETNVSTKQDETGAINSASHDLHKVKDLANISVDKPARDSLPPEIPSENCKNSEFTSTQGFTPAISRGVHDNVESGSLPVTLPESGNLTTVVKMSGELPSPSLGTGNCEKKREGESSSELARNPSDFISESKDSGGFKCRQEGACEMTAKEKSDNVNHLVGKSKQQFESEEALANSEISTEKFQENVFDDVSKCDEKSEEPVARKSNKVIRSDSNGGQCNKSEDRREGKLAVVCNKFITNKSVGKENAVEGKTCMSESKIDVKSTHTQEVYITSENGEIGGKRNKKGEKEGYEIKKEVPYAELSEDSENNETNRDGNESVRTIRNGKESERTSIVSFTDEKKDRIGKYDRENEVSADSRENTSADGRENRINTDGRENQSSADGREHKISAEGRENKISQDGRESKTNADGRGNYEIRKDGGERDMTKVGKETQRTDKLEKKKEGDSLARSDTGVEMDSKDGKVAYSNEGKSICATNRGSSAMVTKETSERIKEKVRNKENESGGRVTPETLPDCPYVSGCNTAGQSVAGKKQESISERFNARASRSRSRSVERKRKISDEYNHPSLANQSRDSYGSISPIEEGETRGRKRKLFNSVNAEILQETPPEPASIAEMSKTAKKELGRDVEKGNVETSDGSCKKRRRKQVISSTDLEEADANQHGEGKSMNKTSGKLNKRQGRGMTARKQRKRNKWKKQWEQKRTSFSRGSQFLESPHVDSDDLEAHVHTVYSDFESSDGYSWINGNKRKKGVPIYRTYESTQTKKTVKRRKPRKKQDNSVNKNVGSDDEIFKHSPKKNRKDQCNFSKRHPARSSRNEINYHETSELSSSSLTETSCSKLLTSQEKKDKKRKGLTENEILNETKGEKGSIFGGKHQWSSKIAPVIESPEILRNTSHGTLNTETSTSHDLTRVTSLSSASTDKKQRNVSTCTEHLSPEVFDAAHYNLSEHLTHRSSSVDGSVLPENIPRGKTRTEFNMNLSDPYPPLKVPHNTPESGAISPIPVVTQNLTAQIYSRLHSGSSERNAFSNPLQSTLICEEGRDNQTRFTYVSEAEVSYDNRSQPNKENLSHSNTQSSNNMNYSATLNDGIPSWLPLDDTADLSNRYEACNVMPTQPWSPFERNTSSESDNPQMTPKLQNSRAPLDDSASSKNKDMEIIDSASDEVGDDMHCTEDKESSLSKDGSQPECYQDSEKTKRSIGKSIPTQVALTLSQLVDSFPQTSRLPALNKATPQPPNPRVLFLPHEGPSPEGEAEKDSDTKIQYLKEQVLAMHNFLREAYFRSLSVLDVVKDLT